MGREHGQAATPPRLSGGFLRVPVSSHGTVGRLLILSSALASLAMLSEIFAFTQHQACTEPRLSLSRLPAHKGSYVQAPWCLAGIEAGTMMLLWCGAADLLSSADVCGL